MISYYRINDDYGNNFELPVIENKFKSPVIKKKFELSVIENKEITGRATYIHVNKIVDYVYAFLRRITFNLGSAAS